jgi:hypothetical protein
MVEWLVTRAMRPTEAKHVGVAVAEVGEWSGRGRAPERGPGALRCVRGHTGVAMERRTVG